MKLTDAIGKSIRINANSITVLNDEGKTSGMITKLDTYYNIPQMNERHDLTSKARQLMGKQGDNWRKFLSRLFKDGKEWFYIVDEKENAKIQEWLDFCPQGINPQDITFMNTQEETATAFGASIIHVSSVIDTRKI